MHSIGSRTFSMAAPVPNLDSPPEIRTGEADERRLIDRIANQRNTAALERLYVLYAPRLSRFLRRLTSNPEIIEEVCNDVMWAVWQRASSFGGRSKVSTWIFSIAYRICIRILKKSAWRPEISGDAYEHMSETRADESSVDDDSEDLISMALSELSPKHRMVIELSYFLDLSYDEIAEIVDCPVNTVKTRIFHARRQLREIVTKLS